MTTSGSTAVAIIS